MTKDETIEYQRNTAALILAAMYTAYIPPRPPANDTDAARKEYEQALNLDRMRAAEHAFSAAGALCAEATLHEGPTDDDGERLDERALDPRCIHGNKADEPCQACDARPAAGAPRVRDNEATHELLGQVLPRVTPLLETVAGWSDDEEALAYAWAEAARVYLSDTDARLPPMPALLSPYA